MRGRALRRRRGKESTERLTWAERCARYPNQCAVLMAIEATDTMLWGASWVPSISVTAHSTATAIERRKRASERLF